MSKFLSENAINKMFEYEKYVYFTTLKPPASQNRINEVDKFCTYLDKRKIKYWIVKCTSPEGYEHYHGVVSYPCETLEAKMDANKLAYQRKVNRDIGFSYPLQQVQHLRSVYRYIHKDSNAPSFEWFTGDHY